MILVNDGSSAEESKILRSLAQTYDLLSLVERTHNGGKGAAVKSGLSAAYERGYSHALQIDADGQHDVGDVPKMLGLARCHPEAVIAGQPVYDESAPRGRIVARYLTHIWVWLETLSFSIKDSMCGFRVYPLRQVVELLESSRLGDRMDFDPEVLVRLQWRGVPIFSLPTQVIYPKGGQSHFRLVEDNCRITMMHTRLVIGMLLRLPVLLARKGRREPRQAQKGANPRP